MIPKEILRKVRHIEIRTTRLVNDLFGGEYESVFKGKASSLPMSANTSRVMIFARSIGTSRRVRSSLL